MCISSLPIAVDREKQGLTTGGFLPQHSMYYSSSFDQISAHESDIFLNNDWCVSASHMDQGGLEYKLHGNNRTFPKDTVLYHCIEVYPHSSIGGSCVPGASCHRNSDRHFNNFYPPRDNILSGPASGSGWALGVAFPFDMIPHLCLHCRGRFVRALGAFCGASIHF